MQGRVGIDAGDALILYSDGLMERRGEGIDAGLERLRRAAERAGGRDAEGICSAVLADLFPDANPQDDVVLLVARRMPPE